MVVICPDLPRGRCFEDLSYCLTSTKCEISMSTNIINCGKRSVGLAIRNFIVEIKEGYCPWLKYTAHVQQSTGPHTPEFPTKLHIPLVFPLGIFIIII